MCSSSSTINICLASSRPCQNPDCDWEARKGAEQAQQHEESRQGEGVSDEGVLCRQRTKGQLRSRQAHIA